MNKPVIQVHTIKQWMELSDAQRYAILTNLKMKDRLHEYLRQKQLVQPQPLDEAKWVKCHDCGGTGYVELHPRYPGIHPSQFSSQCLLKIYWDMIGKEQKKVHTSKLMGIFDLGTAVHNMMQEYGKKGAWGPVYEAEVDIGNSPVGEALHIEGHADADNLVVVDTPDTIYEVYVVHEYKSINDRGFKELKGRPKPEHKQQATIYSACLDRPIVVYFYINKNDSTIQDFPVPFDMNFWSTIHSKAVTLVGHWTSGSEAPPTVGYHCKDCAYQYNCHAWNAVNGRPNGNVG